MMDVWINHPPTQQKIKNFLSFDKSQRVNMCACEREIEIEIITCRASFRHFLQHQAFQWRSQ